MPRYEYITLRVSCTDVRDFGLDQMRAAVEYLREAERVTPINGFIGLVAVARVVDAGPFKYEPKPRLSLAEIEGKTPREVWEMFDALIDADRERLARRAP